MVTDQKPEDQSGLSSPPETTNEPALPETTEQKLEQRVQGIYREVLGPLAERMAFDLPTAVNGAPSLPTVLFLGNHSSGKSSFINHLIETPLQKTGLAPTDDGFTIITFGEKPDTFDGQTVVTHPDLPFKNLQRFGPAFISRLRLRAYPHELLKISTLIDSPGMIDAAGTAKNRGYDFTASVRYFAELADLVIFFFDPDKPGTTGETVSIFTETLAGLEHKLLIVLNKVDLFENIRDFARTYGTLCWNLSKTIKTKDIPHIYNTYIPGAGVSSRNGSSAAIPLKDFDASREEIVQEIRRAPTRRADNLVSDLHKNARELSMHTRVCGEVAREYRMMRARWWGVIIAILAATVVTIGFTRQAESWKTPVIALFVGVALAGTVRFISDYFLNRFRNRIKREEELDPFFERAYRRELTMQDRADLRAGWEAIRHQTAQGLLLLGPKNKASSRTNRKVLRRIDGILRDEVPKMRRSIAEYLKRR